MDLSPTLFWPALRASDWTMLLAIVDARQAASPTARAQTRLDAPAARPGGAFARSVATSLARWKE